MRYCQHCGKELLDDALICIGCGRVVQAQNSVNQCITNDTAATESEAGVPEVKSSANTKDNKWVVRLFSYFLSILASVLYVCSRSLSVFLSYDQTSQRIYTGYSYVYIYDKFATRGEVYTSFDMTLFISSFVLFSIAAILAITDIALTGVDVSKRKLSTSKLCSPIISLLLPILLAFAFLFMR